MIYKRPAISRPPMPRKEKVCEHKYNFIDSEEKNGSNVYRFYCEKCLDFQEKEAGEKEPAQILQPIGFKKEE